MKEEEIKCAEKEKLKNLELQRINKQLMEVIIIYIIKSKVFVYYSIIFIFIFNIYNYVLRKRKKEI